MGFNLGQLYNTAVTVGLAAAKENDSQGGKRSLKDYLETMNTYGYQIKSNFEIEFNGFNGITFLCQNITTPGLKTNEGAIYYKGREVRVPINYEQEHDFTITIIDDATGFAYTQMRQLLINDFANRKLQNGYTITVNAMSDDQNTAGKVIKMYGVRLKNIGGLDYGFNSNEIATFEVQCSTTQMQFQYTKIEKKEGLLSKIDNVAGAIGNIFGR